MAVDGRFFSVPGVNLLLDQGEMALSYMQTLQNDFYKNEFNGNLATINRLEKVIEQQIRYEQENILPEFKDHPVDEAGLRRLFSEFSINKKLNLLTGLNLKLELEGFELAKDQQTLELVQLADVIGQQVMNTSTEIIKEEIEKGGDIYTILHRQVRAIVSDIIENIPGARSQAEDSFLKSTLGTTQKKGFFTGDNLNLGQPLYSLMTKGFKKRLKFIKDYLPELRTIKKWDWLKIEDSSFTADSVSMTIGGEIYTSVRKTGATTETEVKEIIKRGDPQKLAQLDAINIRIIDKIADKIGDPLFKNFLWDQVKVGGGHPELFFTGESSSQLVGIIGEMAAYYATSNLLADKYKQQALQWVATNKINGKQLSADLVIKELTNIQVKTSKSELESASGLTFDLADAEASYVLQKLGYNEVTSGMVGDVLTSDKFNVGYVPSSKKDKRVDYGNPQEFMDTRARITQVKNDIMKFLEYFSPEFAYLANDRELGEQLAILDTALTNRSGNDMYIVNLVPYLASGMLQKILDNLRNIQRTYGNEGGLKISTYLKREAKTKEEEKNMPKDIVQYINTYGAGELRKKRGDVIGKYHANLRSSYSFKT